MHILAVLVCGHAGTCKTSSSCPTHTNNGYVETRLCRYRNTIHTPASSPPHPLIRLPQTPHRIPSRAPCTPVWVCICVCACVCVYVCIDAYINRFSYTCKYSYIQVQSIIFICIQNLYHMYSTHTINKYMRVCMNMYIDASIDRFTCTYMYSCIYVHSDIFMYVQMYVNMYPAHTSNTCI